jgi:hypothetical protein
MKARRRHSVSFKDLPTDTVAMVFIRTYRVGQNTPVDNLLYLGSVVNFPEI